MKQTAINPGKKDKHGKYHHQGRIEDFDIGASILFFKIKFLTAITSNDSYYKRK